MISDQEKMFQIKICGITNEDDAVMACEAGADALGLNFYPKSSRFISLETAERIVRVIPSNVVKVGLFVNAEIDVVKQTFDSLSLDLIQLHGDEPPEYLAQLADRPIMKAFRLSAEGLPPIQKYLDRCRDIRGTGFQPVAENMRQVGNLSHVLFDSHVEGYYGGSGIPPDWKDCSEFARTPGSPPMVLAGGLTPENVAQAIREVRPAAVDTASGVETAPGRKNRELTAAFVKNARAAFLSKDG
jgi:phosphoribosylanthranilate isomerase